MQRLSDISQLHDEMMKDPKYRRQYEADQQSKAYEEQQQHLRDLAKMVDTIGYDRLRELVTAEVEGRAVVLPCKPGDVFGDNPEYVHSIEAVGLLVQCNEDSEWFSLDDFYDEFSDDFTRAEAEAKG